MQGCILPATIPVPANILQNSSWCALHRTAGQMVWSSKRFNPGAATLSTNLFQVTGEVELKALYGVFTDVTNVAAGPTACFWDLYETGGLNAVLTAAAGTNCTGAALSSTVAKTATAAAALTFTNATTPAITEVAGPRQFQGALVQTRSGVTNTIRWTCTTAAATDCTINFCAIWVCRYPGSTLVAV